MMSYVKYVDFIAPEKIMSIDKVFDGLSVPITPECRAKFKKSTRVKKVYAFKGEDEFVSCVEQIIDRFFTSTQIDPLSIDYLICGNDSMYFCNGISVLHGMKKKYGLNNAAILPIAQPCAAALYAMGLSGKLLDDRSKNILILSACYWPDINDRYIDFCMRGDGVGLALIGGDAGVLRIDGWRCSNYCDSSYNRLQASSEDIKLTDWRNSMIMYGIDFVRDSLAKLDTRLSEIKRIIPANIRYDVFDELYSHYLKVDTKIFFLDNIPVGGHMCDVDMLRNLKDCASKRKYKSGDKIVLYTPDVERSFDVNYNLVLLSFQ